MRDMHERFFFYFSLSPGRILSNNREHVKSKVESKRILELSKNIYIRSVDSDSINNNDRMTVEIITSNVLVSANVDEFLKNYKFIDKWFFSLGLKSSKRTITI